MELPEVEVMRRDMEKDVVGRRIKEVEVKNSKNAMRVIRRHKTRKEFTSRLTGRKIAKVERRGKYLMMTLDSGDVLVAHFGIVNIPEPIATWSWIVGLGLLLVACRVRGL